MPLNLLPTFDIENRRPSNGVTPRKYYDVRNATADEAEILIYSEIGYWGTTAEQFARDVAGITAPIINVRLNSPGGDVFAGVAIYNTIKRHGAKIITHVDGIAASIASVIAMAGDELRMGDASYLMIHNPWTITLGDAVDLRKAADALEKIQGSIAGIYASKSKKTVDEFKALMTAETWFTAEEAVEFGLADSAGDEAPKGTGEKNTFDLSIFAKVPDPLKVAPVKNDQRKTPKTIRELEDLLRDAGGFSRSQAKAVASHGFNPKPDPRDEDGKGNAARDFLAEWKW